MADKSVITNLEARVKQLIDDHRRLSELCAELTAQRETLRAEKPHAGRACPGAGRRAGAHAADRRSCGREPEPGKSAGARQPSYAGGGQVHRAAGAAAGSAGGPDKAGPGRGGDRERNERREKMAKQSITLKIAGKSYQLNIDTRKRGGVPAGRTGGEQLPRTNKTTEHQGLERPGLPVDNRVAVRHCERRICARAARWTAKISGSWKKSARK